MLDSDVQSGKLVLDDSMIATRFQLPKMSAMGCRVVLESMVPGVGRMRGLHSYLVVLEPVQKDGRSYHLDIDSKAMFLSICKVEQFLKVAHLCDDLNVREVVVWLANIEGGKQRLESILVRAQGLLL